MNEKITAAIEAFCARRGVAAEGIRSAATKDAWFAKFMIWVYLHCEMGMSASRIAREFGRSRASVFYGIRRMKHHMKYYKGLREEYRAVVAELEGALGGAPSGNMEKKG